MYWYNVLQLININVYKIFFDNLSISDSIRRMKQFKDLSDIEIEKPLKNWMGQASARIKKNLEKSMINQNSTSA